jgi:signal transduction histidine kinase
MANPSVLIVDDDRSIVRLCQRLLERASFEVSASTDPLDALKILEAHPVDLLLVDIRMPVMDGFELIERARAIQPDLAVLVMTGFGTVDTAVQALYKGVDGLILKPFENTADLVLAVQRVLVDSRQKQDAARAQALRPLFDISETLVSETSLDALVGLIQDALVKTYNAQFVSVYFSGTGSKEPKLIIAKDTPDPVVAPAWAQVLRYAFSSQSGAVISISGPGDAVIQNALRSLGWSSLIFTPINRNDQRFLFLAGRDIRQDNFSESDLDLFTILANQSVVALDNAHLYTDLKEYIRKVEDSQRALVQAEKMAAVGRLMASLAHEINNPLQSVRNCVHLAMREDISESQRSNYLSMTETELERLVKTVRHMLDFYRPGTVEKESVDLNGVIERVVYLLRAQLEGAKTQLTTLLPAETVQIFAVKDQLQQVIFNLILNSMDAVDGQKNKRIWVEVGRRESNAFVTIEDSGTGVSAEVQEHMFEPFVSTKKTGTGLGLSISFSIIETHGGRLALVPGKHGNGACFEILLPLEREAEYNGKNIDR